MPFGEAASKPEVTQGIAVKERPTCLRKERRDEGEGVGMDNR
jgi:hypothetical protein